MPKPSRLIGRRDIFDDVIDLSNHPILMPTSASPAPPAAPGVLGATQTWPDPTPLPVHQLLTLPQPVLDTLPGGAMVRDVAVRFEIGAELPLLAMLGTLSTAAGGKFVVAIDEDWATSTTLYSVAAAPPSSMKTPVFDAMNRPVRDHQSALVADAESVERRQVEADVMRKRLQRMQREAGNSDDIEIDFDRMAEIERAIRALEAEAVPPILRKDLTNEALARALAERGRISIGSDEAGVLETFAGRYGTGAPNVDVLLGAYEGEDVRIDRAGRPPITIRGARLSVSLMAQPTMLRDLLGNKQMRQRGVWAGFLAIDITGLPRLVPERSTPVGSSSPPRSWARTVDNLLHINDGAGRNLPSIRLTPAATALVREARQSCRTAAAGEHSDIEDWINKQPTRTVRVAALLHAARHSAQTDPRLWPPIGADLIRDAQALDPFFLAHAKRLLGEYRPSAAERLLDWVRTQRPSHFTVTEAHVALRGTRDLSTAAQVTAAAAALATAGWLRPAPLPYSGRGRPSSSPRYEVHPNLSAHD